MCSGDTARYELSRDVIWMESREREEGRGKREEERGERGRGERGEGRGGQRADRGQRAEG